MKTAPRTDARPPSRRLPRLRTIWLKVHLWFGLVVGLVLAIVGLSGAALVFAEPIVRAEHGDILFPNRPIAPPSEWAPIDTWVAKTKARYPELEQILVVAAPHAAPLPAAVPLVAGHLHHAEGAPELHGAVAIDPATGDPLGMVVIEKTWWGWLINLHAALTVLPYGLFVTAFSGMFLLISVATGLYLWWPRNDRTWRQALTVKRGASGRRQLLDWHNVVAVWLLVPIVVATLSGVYLLRPMWFDWALRATSTLRVPEPADLKPKAGAACEATQSLDRVLEIGRAGQPDLKLRLLIIPEKAEAPYMLSLMPAGAPTRVAATELWIARDCAQVLFARPGGTLSMGETVKSWISPIHAEFALGIVGQILVALAGVSLPFLYVTGVWLWLKRRVARAAAGAARTRLVET
jgi:uncharacterized iron-regulated membrane protein